MTLAQIAAIISLLLAFGVDQPTVTNVSAILYASQPSAVVSPLPQSTPAISPQTAPGATMPVMTEVTQFKLYGLSYEPTYTTPGFYYSGNKELASVKINGVNAPISYQQINPNCIQLWNDDGSKGEKVCNYQMARIPSARTESDTVEFTATDGTKVSKTF